jgi:adenylate cyclase class 2
MRANLEVKFKVRDLKKLRQRVNSFGRRSFNGSQVDTYFNLPRARLKLRETKAGAELIFYERPNRPGARRSFYTTTTVKEPRQVKRRLSRLLGVQGVVEKRREVYVYRGGRIHLDKVKRIGTFLEIEIPIHRNSTRARELMRELVTKLRLEGLVAVASSYVDLCWNPSKTDTR